MLTNFPRQALSRKAIFRQAIFRQAIFSFLHFFRAFSHSGIIFYTDTHFETVCYI